MSLLPVGVASSGAYTIQKAVRFRASGGPGAMTRTFGAAGNRKIWTHSVWLHRGALGSVQQFLTVGATANDITTFALTADNKLDSLNNIGGSTVARLTSAAVLRDDSAQYHCVVAWDTTNATADNRIRMWISGVEITSFTTRTNPTLNQDTQVNTAAAMWLGRSSVASANHIDGCLSEINHVDGEALTASSFGEFDANGIWVPKKYTGSYGTNGFYLPFDDGTNLTNLCLDRSGNGNNFTASGISLTAGATYDWMDDTPSNGFCTLSKLNANSDAIVANGNLSLASAIPGSVYGTSWGTHGFSSGKYYWECTQTGTAQVSAGVSTTATNYGGYVGSSALSWGYISTSGQKFTGGGGAAYGPTTTTGDVIGVAMDADNGTLTFYKNGVSMGTAFSSLPSQTYLPMFATIADTLNVNFGQRPFAYSPPSGFVALNTQNLTNTTVITSGNFTGNASTDGPWVWLNGVPTAMTINGNAVTFGTQADKLANGFKVRSSSASYNVSGNNTFSVSTTGPALKTARAQVNP